MLPHHHGGDGDSDDGEDDVGYDDQSEDGEEDFHGSDDDNATEASSPLVLLRLHQADKFLV